MLSFISRDDFDARCPSLEHIELEERYVLEQPHEKIELVYFNRRLDIQSSRSHRVSSLDKLPKPDNNFSRIIWFRDKDRAYRQLICEVARLPGCYDNMDRWPSISHCL